MVFWVFGHDSDIVAVLQISDISDNLWSCGGRKLCDRPFLCENNPNYPCFQYYHKYFLLLLLLSSVFLLLSVLLSLCLMILFHEKDFFSHGFTLSSILMKESLETFASPFDLPL